MAQTATRRRHFTVVFRPDQEEGGYTVEIPALPGCITQGESWDEALEMIEDAARLWIETADERGWHVPAERGEPERVVLILSDEHRSAINEAAKGTPETRADTPYAESARARHNDRA